MVKNGVPKKLGFARQNSQSFLVRVDQTSGQKLYSFGRSMIAFRKLSDMTMPGADTGFEMSTEMSNMFFADPVCEQLESCPGAAVPLSKRSTAD